MYSRLNDSEFWSLPKALSELAEKRPNDTWIVTTSGDRLTYSQGLTDAQCVASLFSGLGVQWQQHVGVMLPNGVDFVRAWMGLSILGAVPVLLNTELEGSFFRHQLCCSDVEVLLISSEQLGALTDVASSVPKLKTVIVIGQADVSDDQFSTVVDWQNWRDQPPYEGQQPGPREIGCIIFTSGTTGPAKAVLMPHAHCFMCGLGFVKAMEITESDRHYIPLPLFHTAGLFIQLGATLVAGSSAVLRERFSAKNWLSDITQHKATVSHLIGAMVSFVLQQPNSERDKEHALRGLIYGPTVPQQETQFRERFGIADVFSTYGMTEVNLPVWGRKGVACPGAVGWVNHEHYELIVADPDTDLPLAPGEKGEILVRPKTPFCFMAGYYNAPEKTVEAWRNLWFHTGDLGVFDEHGVLTFIDRLKDCIRRRGENISATEIESVLMGLEGISELSAYAVPSEILGGEDEIMLAIVADGDKELDLVALGKTADTLLPRFARIRYLEQFPELPKTASGKVQRKLLQDHGRENALDRGMRVSLRATH